MTLWRGTPSKNIILGNNIFWGHQALINFQGLAHRPLMDYNLWFSTEGRRTFSAAQQMFQRGQLAWERHGLFGPPRLSPTFLPLAQSPAIDRGTILSGLNLNFRGRAPDIGAFEAAR
jgi:hypothetical protein